jgi:hypothetical protein
MPFYQVANRASFDLTRHFRGRILGAMTMADLSPDHLAVLESKLRADLEAVQKVRALMEDHLNGGASAIAGLAVVPVPPVPPPGASFA